MVSERLFEATLPISKKTAVLKRSIKDPIPALIRVFRSADLTKKVPIFELFSDYTLMFQFFLVFQLFRISLRFSDSRDFSSRFKFFQHSIKINCNSVLHVECAVSLPPI